MSVVCESCHAVNRDNAMFCLGCAGKLPAFAATGPSALQAVKARATTRSRRSQPEMVAPLPFEKPSVWLGTGLIVAIVLCAFAGWYVYVTRKVPLVDAVTAEHSAPSEAARLRSAAAAGTSMPLAISSPGTSRKGAPVPLAASLSELESVVDAGAPPQTTLVTPSGTPTTGSQSIGGSSGTLTAAATGSEPSGAPTAAPPPARAERSGADRRVADAEPPRTAPAATAPTRQTAMNPMRGCEHLNFIFAARCEASHCERPEYTRHPRCDAVREQRKRDEARRNPTLGF